MQDTFINNMIFRPGELEHLGLYDMISQYHLKRMTKEKLESGNVLVKSKTTFNIMDVHPSHE